MLDCYDNSTCTTDTRLKLGKFLGCFEGGHIESYHCPQSPSNCSTYAGLEAELPAIMECYNNPALVQKAAEFNTRACTAQNISGWPHVLIDNKVTNDGLVPVLPTLCNAYKGQTKPKSCSMLEQGLLHIV